MKYFIVSIVIIISYMIVTAHRNKLVSHTIPAPLPKDFTLFFISDVHNRTINQNMLAKVGTVDAVIIGGDFCDKRTPLTKVEKNIKRLAACGKVYFVWGNNDRELEEAQLRALYQRCGVTIVENNAIPLTDKLWLSAIEDTSSRNYSFEQGKFYSIAIFSAILSLALLLRGFISTSSAEGTITLLLISLNGLLVLPKKSCSAFPSALPVFITFFTMRSSNE